jgi:hypothetical protein
MRKLFCNNKGVTLLELMLAIAISIGLLTGIISIFLFAYRTTLDTQDKSEISKEVYLVLGIIKDKIAYANNLYIPDTEVYNRLYIKRKDKDNNDIFECFVFGKNLQDIDNEKTEFWELYYCKYLEEELWNKRLIAKGISNIKFSFPESNFGNIVKIVVSYGNPDNLVSRTILVTAKNITKVNNNIINPEDEDIINSLEFFDLQETELEQESEPEEDV